MYQGKHLNKNKRRRRRNKQKATMLLTSLVLLFTLLIGGTVAFMIATDDSAKNVFMDSTVSCEVHENFSGNVKSNVTIKNTGDTAAYIRAAIVVTWKDAENGNVYGSVPVKDSDYEIELNLGDWIDGKDGFYYYKYPVAPNASTEALINSCSPVSDKTPEGYGLNVEILGSAIQSVPVSVVNEKWPAVHVDTAHGTLTKVN